MKKHQTNTAETNVVHIRKISTGVAISVPLSYKDLMVRLMSLPVSVTLCESSSGKVDLTILEKLQESNTLQ